MEYMSRVSGIDRNLLIAGVCTLVLAVLLGVGGLALVPSYLVAVNLVTVGFFFFDKGQAGSRGERVPEVVLLGLALAGGTPGAFLGQVVFRHKTRKTGFNAVLAMIGLVQLVVFWMWIRRSG